MHPETPNNSIKDSVLASIQSHSIIMKPKWHFLLRTALVIVGAVLTALALVYVVSFTVFMLRQNGALYAPTFGLAGVEELLRSLPWIFVLLALVFLTIVEILVRQYSFAYKRPLVVSVAGLTLLVCVSGFLVDKTHLHEEAYRQATMGKLPFAGALYRVHSFPPMRNAVIGLIKTKTATGFTLEGHRHETFVVTLTPETIVNDQDVTINDLVMVFGSRINENIQAVGVQELPEAPPWIEHDIHTLRYNITE